MGSKKICTCKKERRGGVVIHDLIDGRFTPNISKFLSSMCPDNDLLRRIRELEMQSRTEVEKEYMKMRMKCQSLIKQLCPTKCRVVADIKECNACELYAYEIYLNVNQPIAPYIQLIQLFLSLLKPEGPDDIQARYLALLQDFMFSNKKKGVNLLKEFVQKK